VTQPIRPLVAGNWKMNGLKSALGEAVRVRDALASGSAAADVMLWRRQVLADLGHAGVLTLDVEPAGLTAAVINEYLAIKARHLL
jgi:hypothetical protein